MPTTLIRTFAGRVGIGIANPTERLEVAGNVKTTGVNIGTNVNAFVPQGAIMIWSGSIASIPGGWGICDGTNDTPDLRNRFILSSGSTYTINTTGGSMTKTLAVENLPAHNHTGTGDAVLDHTHTVSTGQAGSHTHPVATGQAGSHLHGVGTASGGSHIHPVSCASYTTNHGHSNNTNGTGQHGHVSTNRVLLKQDCGNTRRSSDWTPGEPDIVGSYQYFGSYNHQHNYGLGQNTHGHNLAITQNGSHAHSFNLTDGGSHTHPYSINGVGTHTHVASTGSAALHSHTSTVDSTGIASAFSTLPPYYALAFIMKL